MEYWKKDAYKESVSKSACAVVDGKGLAGKRILLTGASGLVGSFVADILIELKAEVFVAGRDPESLRARFPEATALKYDLTSDIGFDEPFNYVIHAAGYGHPAAFHDDPVGTLASSFTGVSNLLEYSRQHQMDRFVFISSGEVYGGIDAMNPRACYPVGKQAAECMCASYNAQYGMDTVVARLCHTFGPAMGSHDNRATAQFFRNALSGEDIVLKSKGEQLRSYLYAGDSASAILSVLTSGESGTAYDIASADCTITIAGLAEEIAKAAGVKVRYEFPNETEKSQQSPIEKQVMDGARLEEMGWKGKYSITDGTTATIEALR